ncbi:GUN4 domain-containing protein, partial [filamentous cyanobacterium LEGE 11480]
MAEEESTLTKPQQDEQSIAPKGMPLWQISVGGALWKWLSGGAALGSLVTVINTTDLPKIALGAAAGGALSGGGAIVYAFADPVGKRAKKAAGAAGNKTVEVIDWSAEQLWAKATKVETKYCLAQAEECEGYRPEGVRQYPGLGKPMLRDVFVPLLLIGQGRQAGYGCDVDEALGSALRHDNLDIWQLLKRARKHKEFRRIAVLAHGGFGKTTLLRHVAYTFGRGEQGRYGMQERVPILLLLRQYKQQFAQDVIPGLPELLQTLHLPSLGRAAELPLPQTWAKDLLESGRAIVMLDGFDELNPQDRTQSAQWLNRQMKRYSNCIFIVTSRPKAFNAQPVNEQLDVSLAMWVRDFGQEEQGCFIEKWYRCQERIAAGEPKETAATKREALREAKRLMQQIFERPELGALAINPLLLNMIVTFHRLRPWGPLPVLRSGLYREICQLQIVDRPEARSMETVLPGVDTLGMLQKLALEMMQRGVERISRQDLQSLITGYLQADGEQPIDVGRWIEDVVNVTEMLVDQGEEYDFAHLTFQEYLAAAEIQRVQKASLLYDQLSIDRWKMVILYYAGLVRNPSDLVQRLLLVGNTALATECLREAKRLEPAVVAQIEALDQQVSNDRYKQLQALLKAGNWEAADRETFQVMLQVAGQEERGFLLPSDFTNFPCDDLQAIDKLWVDSSSGHFGFSVQKEIWADCGSPMDIGKEWNDFCDRVGWQASGKYLNYSDLWMDPYLSPVGELP